MTIKSKRVKKENWMIFRLRGMNSVLNSSTIRTLKGMLPKEYHKYIYKASKSTKELLEVIEKRRKI